MSDEHKTLYTLYIYIYMHIYSCQRSVTIDQHQQIEKKSERTFRNAQNWFSERP